MRDKELIIQGSPCGVDYRDKSIQTIPDAKKKGRVVCKRYIQCERDVPSKYACTMLFADRVARQVVKGSNLESEMKDFRKEAASVAPEGWITLDLEVEENFSIVCEHVKSFAVVILDPKEGDEKYLVEKKESVARCPKCKEGNLYFEGRIPDSFGPNAPFPLAGSGSITNLYICDKCHKRYDTDDLDMIRIKAMSSASK